MYVCMYVLVKTCWGSLHVKRLERAKLKRALGKGNLENLPCDHANWIWETCGHALLSRAGYENHMKSNIGRPSSSSVPQWPDGTVSVICGKVCKSASGLERLYTKTVFFMRIQSTQFTFWLLCVMSVIVLVNQLSAFRATWEHIRDYSIRNMKLGTAIICGDAAITMYVWMYVSNLSITLSSIVRLVDHYLDPSFNDVGNISELTFVKKEKKKTVER